jgi:hypothetical protein
MLSELIARIKAHARKRRRPAIILLLLSVIGLVWDVLVDTHTVSWLFEFLRLPTIGWFAALATNHLGLVPLAIVLGSLAGLGFLFRPAKPAITHPRNRDLVNTPITISGTHDYQTDNYWLVSNEGYNYWPKRRVTFQPDGRWDEQFYTGGGKRVTISLVKVNDIVQTLFENWVRNANKTQNWNALVLPQTHTTTDLTTVDSIVVTIAKT